MDIDKLRILLFDGDEYQPFVEADLRSGVRDIEIPEVHSASKGLTIPEGNVIESVHIEEGALVVRAGELAPEEPKLAKVPAAVALADAIFTKRVDGVSRVFLKNNADNSGNLMLYECASEEAAEGHRCAIVDYLLRALEKSV